MACGCGPGLAQQDTRDVGRDALAKAADDPATLEAMLAGSVVNGGLWFENADCAQQFGKPGEIHADRMKAFAACLASLHLRPSQRADALGDVSVMHYAPGFEVEARIVQELGGPRLTWIGYEARRDDRDNFPTISAGVLESLRTAGDPNGPIDPAVGGTLELEPMKSGKVAFSWLKLCIDETGAVSDASVRATTSLEAAKVFANAARTWTFKPFTMEDQPVPVCAMVRLVYPPGQGPMPEVIPFPVPRSRSGKDPIVFPEGVHTVLEGKRIAGKKAIVPDDETKVAIETSRRHRLVGSFRVCIDESGHVESAVPMRSTGYASYDREILQGIGRWAYSPFQVDGQAVPVCTAVTFIYTQR